MTLADNTVGYFTADMTRGDAKGRPRTFLRRLGKMGTMPEAFSTNLPVTNQGLIVAWCGGGNWFHNPSPGIMFSPKPCEVTSQSFKNLSWKILFSKHVLNSYD